MGETNGFSLTASLLCSLTEQVETQLLPGPDSTRESFCHCSREGPGAPSALAFSSLALSLHFFFSFFFSFFFFLFLSFCFVRFFLLCRLFFDLGSLSLDSSEEELEEEVSEDEDAVSEEEVFAALFFLSLSLFFLSATQREGGCRERESSHQTCWGDCHALIPRYPAVQFGFCSSLDA